MIVGIDVGYSHTKMVSETVAARFASICGNVERAEFSLNEQSPSARIVHIPDDGDWVIGEDALYISRFRPRHEDRDWIVSPIYRRYYLTSLTELTTATYVEIEGVTGLPVTYFARDQQRLVEQLQGEFRVQREGRSWQRFRVTRMTVIPQPFGTLLSEVLNDAGRITNQSLAAGRVGVVDVGGKTTGYLCVHNLAEIPAETTSIDIGCWEALTLIRDAVNARYPGLELDDHETALLVSNGAAVSYYGETRDVSDIVRQAVAPLAERVIAEATTLWNGGARLDAILVTGGGAALVGQALCRRFPHARIVADSAFANARGYYRFARRLHSG